MKNETRQQRRSLRQDKRAKRKESRLQKKAQCKAQREKFWALIKQAFQSLFGGDNAVEEEQKKDPKGMEDKKQHKTYRDLFPEADVAEMIASGINKKISDTDDKKLSYIVYIDSNKDLTANVINPDNLDADKSIKMEKNIALVRLTDTFPIKVLSDEEKICFRKILGFAYVSILEGAYDNVPLIRKSAIEYASCRNREQTRRTILSTASWITIITLLVSFVIYSFLPQCKDCLPNWGWLSYVYKFTSSKMLFAMFMGIIGSYISLWMRCRRLGVLSYGTKGAIQRETCCRMLVGAIFAIVAVLCVKSGLLFTGWATDPITMGIVGLVAGFSERLIPNLIEKIVKSENNDKDDKSPEDVFLADTELAPGSTDGKS